MTTTATPSARQPLLQRLADDRHSLPTTLVLHLAPGAAFVAVAVPLVRQAEALGLPPVFGLLAANTLGLVPVQLGLVALAAKRRTGSWSPRGALGYTRRLPARRLLLLGFATLTWAGAAFVLTAPISEALHASVFAWWPEELDYTRHITDPHAYTRTLLIAAWALGLVLTTVAVPVVEEVYFRGYLLPRLEHLGRWAPVLNTVLFALYHLWSPWQVLTRVAATLPLFYATWRTKALVLAIGVHVALNFVGDTIASAPIVFGR